MIDLDPVELNGDEYQNIEISADKQGQKSDNQTRPDSLNITNDYTSKTRVNAQPPPARINSLANDDENNNSNSGTDSTSSSRRQSKINHHHIRASNQHNEEKFKGKQLSNVLTAKSAFSSRFR